MNSFGYGGSNAHCIVDDAYNYLKSRGLSGNHNSVSVPPTQLALDSPSGNQNGLISSSYADAKAVAPKPQLLVWSAPDESSLNRLTLLYQKFLNEQKYIDLDYYQQLTYTLSERRTRFAWRSYTVCSSQSDLQTISLDTISKPVRSLKNPKLGFIFTGQGSQWARMGYELRNYPSYSKSLDLAESYLHSLGCEWSLRGKTYCSISVP